ncbi:unnamed protein product, partial [Adineta steineri]
KEQDSDVVELANASNRRSVLKYNYEGVEFVLIITIKTGEISFRIENYEIRLNYGIKQTLKINSLINFNKSFKTFELINQTEFNHNMDMTINEIMIELNKFKLTPTSTGEGASGGVDPFDVLIEVIRENKQRIISEQEPELITIKQSLKKDD